MPENILKTRIQQKIDTSANWASSNLILKDGEIGIERTTNNKTKIKIGDGVNTWANLPYATNESSGESSGAGVDEIYIGTTEPTGYKLWINPEEDEDEIASSFIIPVIFSEDAQTGSPIVSSEITFAEINTQYLKDANLKLRGTLSDAIVDIPFIAKITVSAENSFFIFGLFNGDSFMSIMVSNNNSWEQETQELGKTYNGGDGIEITNNNTIRSTYGDPVTVTTNFATLSANDPNAMIIINDGSDPSMEENMGIPAGIGIIQIPIANYLPAGSTATINFKSNNTIVKTATDTVKTINIGSDAYYVGNQDIIKAFFLSDETAMAALESVINDTWVLLTVNMDGTLVAILIFSASYATEQQIDEIEIQISEIKGKTIPSNAIRAGSGIKVEANATIGLDYGSTNNKKFGDIWKTNQLPTADNYLIGQIYAWYSTGWSGIKFEQGQSPSLFNKATNLIMQYYADGQQRTGYFNYYSMRNKQYRETIDYEKDSYYAIPIYIEEYQKLLNGQTESDSLVICKEMEYNDNPFYNYLAPFLNQDQPSSNVFYAGTYNCQETVKEAGTNGVITPLNQEKPGIVFLFLNTYNNNWYFFIFSNANDLGLNGDSSGLCITQGIFFTKQSGIPLQVLTSGYNNNDANSIVLGSYNQAKSDTDCGQIILGKGNTAGTSDAQLILGEGNDSSSSCYFQIGSKGTNIFEVGSKDSYYGVHINSNVYKNNYEVVLPKKINQFPRIQNTLNSESQLSDVIQAYNNLFDNYNNLLTQLQNCGLINNLN